MIGQFEQFLGGPGRKKGLRMHVSLSERCVIMLNRKAFEGLGRPEAVLLHYDRKNNVIGVTKAQRHLAISFPICARPACWMIFATPFCRHFGIRVDATVVFTDPEIDGKGMLRLNLRTTTEAGWGKMGKRARKDEG